MVSWLRLVPAYRSKKLSGRRRKKDASAPASGEEATLCESGEEGSALMTWPPLHRKILTAKWTPERRREYQRNYYLSHREDKREYSREYGLKYYAENRTKISERRRIRNAGSFYVRNRGRIRLRLHRYFYREKNQIYYTYLDLMFINADKLSLLIDDIIKGKKFLIPRADYSIIYRGYLWPF